MEIQKTQWFTVFQNGEITLTKTSVLYTTIDQLLIDYPSADGWLVIPTTDLPADFSIETYTIIDGQLSPASPEIIAERQAIQAIATHEAIRIARQQRYDSEEINSLYWNWVESGNEADKAKWVAAKEAIRQELPYATKAEQQEKGNGE